MTIDRIMFYLVSIVLMCISIDEDAYQLVDGKWKRRSTKKYKTVAQIASVVSAVIYIGLVFFTKMNLYAPQKILSLLGLLALLYSDNYIPAGASCYIANRKLAACVKILWVVIAVVVIGTNVYYFTNIDKYTMTDVTTTTYTISSDYQEDDNGDIAFGPDTFLPDIEKFEYYIKSEEGEKLECLDVYSPEIYIIKANEKAKVVIEQGAIHYQQNDLYDAFTDRIKITTTYKLYLYAN